ncbi:MAG: DUF6158 family protein [Actinomycetota bacterium]|nr:DUF6158 family protein [Actinomycetota bacterium]MDQ2956459.1 DUF6158 family protein [Actinomycetota bacterium]
MALGIPASGLSEDDLRHELLQLKIKQADIQADGTPAQQANHQRRTAELEEEFLRRFGSSEVESGSESGSEPASQSE